MQEDIRRAFIKVGIGRGETRVGSSARKKRRSPLTTRQVMRSCSMCCRIWDRSIRSPIIPTGMGAAGYTMPLPDEDEMFNSKKKMLQNIIVSTLADALQKS